MGSSSNEVRDETPCRWAWDEEAARGWQVWLCWTATIILCIGLVAVLMQKKRSGQPPGPPGLPIIGHLHLMGAVPHRSLYKLAHKYGPILLLRLGCRPMLVISSPALAKEVLHMQDHLFAHRPRIHFVHLVFYRSQGAVFMEQCPRWKALRKLYAQYILSPSTLVASKPIRHAETHSMLRRLRSLPPAIPLDLRSAVFDWMLNVMTRVLFSERADFIRDFPDVFRELSEIFTQPFVADFVPSLRNFIDPGGLEKRLLCQQHRMDAIMETIVSKRLAQVASNTVSMPSDVLTTLLQFEGRIPTPDGKPLLGSEKEVELKSAENNDDVVKALLLEMLAATTDTTTSAVEWAMAELLSHREGVLERLQQEIEEAMKGENTNQVDESLLGGLPYLEAVMMESLRLHPPASILLPHFSKEATQVAGYSIPANTVLVVNAWAIGRDESVWEDVHLFKPERFLSGGSASHISLSGQTNFQLLAFGKGRRGCPGRSLGLLMASLVVANLVHNFEWHTLTPPNLSEKMSAANMLAQPLLPTLSTRHY